LLADDLGGVITLWSHYVSGTIASIAL